MQSYEYLKMATVFMCFSIGSLLMVLLSLLHKLPNSREKHLIVCKYYNIVCFLLSSAVFIFLACNKELFHWNFDISTGLPVDHYSTFNTCLTRLGIGSVCSALGFIAHFTIRYNYKKKGLIL